MHVVADASPLRYLILIGHIDLLPTLFTQIIIVPAVLGELQRAQTPSVVQRYWINVMQSATGQDAPSHWVAVVIPLVQLGY